MLWHVVKELANGVVLNVGDVEGIYDFDWIFIATLSFESAQYIIQQACSKLSLIRICK